MWTDQDHREYDNMGNELWVLKIWVEQHPDHAEVADAEKRMRYLRSMMRNMREDLGDDY